MCCHNCRVIHPVDKHTIEHSAEDYYINTLPGTRTAVRVTYDGKLICDMPASQPASQHEKAHPSLSRGCCLVGADRARHAEEHANVDRCSRKSLQPNFVRALLCVGRFQSSGQIIDIVCYLLWSWLGSFSSNSSSDFSRTRCCCPICECVRVPYLRKWISCVPYARCLYVCSCVRICAIWHSEFRRRGGQNGAKMGSWTPDDQSEAGDERDFVNCLNWQEVCGPLHISSGYHRHQHLELELTTRRPTRSRLCNNHPYRLVRTDRIGCSDTFEIDSWPLRCAFRHMVVVR